MNGTWLENYGPILSSGLRLNYLHEFLEIVGLAHEFIDPSLRSIAMQLRRLRVGLRRIDFLFAGGQVVGLRNGQPIRRS